MAMTAAERGYTTISARAAGHGEVRDADRVAVAPPSRSAVASD